MATRRPAGAFLQTLRVVGAADVNPAVLDLLEMAAQTKVRVPNLQQLGVD